MHPSAVPHIHYTVNANCDSEKLADFASSHRQCITTALSSSSSASAETLTAQSNASLWLSTKNQQQHRLNSSFKQEVTTQPALSSSPSQQISLKSNFRSSSTHYMTTIVHCKRMAAGLKRRYRERSNSSANLVKSQTASPCLDSSLASPAQSTPSTTKRKSFSTSGASLSPMRSNTENKSPRVPSSPSSSQNRALLTREDSSFSNIGIAVLSDSDDDSCDAHESPRSNSFLRHQGSLFQNRKRKSFATSSIFSKSFSKRVARTNSYKDSPPQSNEQDNTLFIRVPSRKRHFFPHLSSWVYKSVGKLFHKDHHHESHEERVSRRLSKKRAQLHSFKYRKHLHEADKKKKQRIMKEIRELVQEQRVCKLAKRGICDSRGGKQSLSNCSITSNRRKSTGPCSAASVKHRHRRGPSYDCSDSETSKRRRDNQLSSLRNSYSFADFRNRKKMRNLHHESIPCFSGGDHMDTSVERTLTRPFAEDAQGSCLVSPISPPNPFLYSASPSEKCSPLSCDESTLSQNGLHLLDNGESARMEGITPLIDDDSSLSECIVSPLFCATDPGLVGGGNPHGTASRSSSIHHYNDRVEGDGIRDTRDNSYTIV